MVMTLPAPPATSTIGHERPLMLARDSFGRAMTYLRISLTDRCNFRCVYCMPAIGMKFQPRDEHLTDEELLRVVGLCAGLGFTQAAAYRRRTDDPPTPRRPCAGDEGDSPASKRSR